MIEYINTFSAKGKRFVEGDLVYNENDALEQIEHYTGDGKIEYVYTVIVSEGENGRVARIVNLENEVDERLWLRNEKGNIESMRADDLRMERE